MLTSKQTKSNSQLSHLLDGRLFILAQILPILWEYSVDIVVIQDLRIVTW